jgi:hypothetical protein
LVQGGGSPDAKRQAELQKAFEKCAGKCVDAHLPVLKTAEGKIASELKKRL